MGRKTKVYETKQSKAKQIKPNEIFIQILHIK